MSSMASELLGGGMRPVVRVAKGAAIRGGEMVVVGVPTPVMSSITFLPWDLVAVRPLMRRVRYSIKLQDQV